MVKPRMAWYKHGSRINEVMVGGKNKWGVKKNILEDEYNHKCGLDWDKEDDNEIYYETFWLCGRRQMIGSKSVSTKNWNKSKN